MTANMTSSTIEIPFFGELSFDEQNHTYRINGSVLPSVTTVMKPLAQSLYRDVDESILRAAADRGTAVHNAIENYLLYGIEDIAKEYEGYFTAFKRWKKEVEPRVLATESRVYHKVLRYAGTADLPVIIEGKKILIDFKTSAQINRMLTGVQLEAYAKAYYSHGFEFDGKAILHLRNDGEYEYLFYAKNDTESWEVFGALLTVHNHIKKYRNMR